MTAPIARGAARALSLFGALAPGVLVWAWLSPSELSFSVASFAGAVAAVAGALALARRPERLGAANRPGSLTSWVVVPLLSGALVWLFGHRQLGGFDHSALIDLGWRMASGQRPGVEFESTLPIGFVLGLRHAFRLFGPRWSAIVAWQAAFAVLTCSWSTALLRRLGEPPLRAALLSFAVQASANLVTSYWWYNPATTTVAALFFLSAAALWRQPESPTIAASYVCSLVLLAGMKPNIAGVLILGVTLTLVSSPAHRRRAIACSGLALALFVGWLALEGVWLPDVLRSYLSISSRGFSFPQFLQNLTLLEKLVALSLLAALLVPWVVALRSAQPVSRAHGLPVSAALAGTYGFLTNGEHKLVDLPLLLLAVWWLGESAGQVNDPRLGGWRRWRALVPALAVVLAVAGTVDGALRQRVRSIGPGIFFEYELSPQPLGTAFFERLRGGQRFVDVERQVGEVLARWPRARVFFGPRMQWAYAAFRLPSPGGQPVWWHRGVSYPDRDDAEAAAVEAWAASRPELLVFLRGDFTYLPAQLRAIVATDYLEEEGAAALSVFVRRLAPPQR